MNQKALAVHQGFFNSFPRSILLVPKSDPHPITLEITTARGVLDQIAKNHFIVEVVLALCVYDDPRQRQSSEGRAFELSFEPQIPHAF